MGYITPSKPVGRLMLNFIDLIPAPPPVPPRCEAASSSAAENDLVEADGAIFLEPGAHLGRRAAGGVAAHDVVAHQAVDLGPVLGGIGGRQRRLVEAGAADRRMFSA